MSQAFDPERIRIRRRNMLAAAALLAPFSLLDLLLPNGGTVALAGAAWCLAILAGAALQRPTAAPLRGLGVALAAVGGVAAVAVKAQATGGSASLFYPLLLALPLLVLSLVPDLPALVALTGLSATAAGAAFRHLEGRGASEVVYWVVLSAGVVGLAVVGALLQRRQQLELGAERTRARSLAAQAEEARRRGELERYAEVGRLAAAVSHELSSPLASVAANLRWLEGGEDGDPAERQAALRDTGEAVQRLAEVVQQIRRVAQSADEDRALAQPGVPATTPVPGRIEPVA